MGRHYPRKKVGRGQLGPPRTTRATSGDKRTQGEAASVGEEIGEEGQSRSGAESPHRKRSCTRNQCPSSNRGRRGRPARVAMSSQAHSPRSPPFSAVAPADTSSPVTPRRAERNRIVQVLSKLDVQRAGWKGRGVSFTGREKVRILETVRRLLEKTEMTKEQILDIVGLSERTLSAWIKEVEKQIAGFEEKGQGDMLVFLPDTTRGNRC